MSANVQGIIALTGRAHCQRQVAFFDFLKKKGGGILKVLALII